MKVFSETGGGAKLQNILIRVFGSKVKIIAVANRLRLTFIQLHKLFIGIILKKPVVGP
jgi:hypothetical protein